MDSTPGAAGWEPGASASRQVAGLEAAVRRHAEQLQDIRRHALSVSLLSWESPAGAAFRTYLSERCTELSRTIDLLDSAAADLRVYEALLLEAEVLQGQAGP